MDGFADLSKAIQSEAEGDVLSGLDGRPIRLQGKRHASLNYLLQSAGAVLCKNWVIRANELAQEAGIDYYPVEFVHEVQMSWSVDPKDVDKALFCITSAIKDIRYQFEFRCELDCLKQLSWANWAECQV